MPEWLKKINSMKGIKILIMIIALGVAGSLLLMDGNAFIGAAKPTSSSDIETRLAAILSSIEGAGQVRVMVYENSVATSNGWLGESTNTSGSPSGVVIVADGANDYRVRFELIRAVQTLLGLPADAVEVFQRAPE